MEGPLASARESGLIRSGEPLLVMLSGGADSMCLLDVAVRLDAQVQDMLISPRTRCLNAGQDALTRDLVIGRGGLEVAAIGRFVLPQRCRLLLSERP